MSLKEEKAGCTAMCRRQAADEAMQSSGKESDSGRVQQGKVDFCQETYEMPIVSWKCSHELEGEKAGCTAMCRQQAAHSQCNRPAGTVTADVCSKEKDDFCRETYEMPIVSWKYSHELEEEEAGCKAMCRRQAAVRQYSRPARRVTADVCIIEKVDFCQETYEMPIVSWKYSHELEG